MKKLLVLFCLLSSPALAQQTIDQLSAGTTLAGTELLPMFQTANPAVTTTPSAINTYIVGKTNTWTAVQTFTNSDIALLGSSTGKTTFTSANAGASNFTLTIPAATDTIALLGAANVFTGNNSFSGTSTWTGSLISKVRSASTTTVTASATTDYFLCLDPSSNAINVALPATPATGLTYLVKDCTGAAATHTITITPNSGNIDGGGTATMTTNYQSVGITYTGSQWSIN